MQADQPRPEPDAPSGEELSLLLPAAPSRPGFTTAISHSRSLHASPPALAAFWCDPALRLEGQLLIVSVLITVEDGG